MTQAPRPAPAHAPAPFCPRCGSDVLLPFEPFYDVSLVASLLGMQTISVLSYIRGRPAQFPRRYRRRFDGLRRHRIRVLTAPEARMLRDLHMWPESPASGTLRAPGTPRKAWGRAPAEHAP